MLFTNRTGFKLLVIPLEVGPGYGRMRTLRATMSDDTAIITGYASNPGADGGGMPFAVCAINLNG